MIPGSIVDREPDADPREGRRDAFVAAARDAFFNHGYAGTAMSAIAARVGGSKTTLWSYFPSKYDLFSAVVDDIVEQFGIALQVDLDPAMPLEAALRRYAQAVAQTVLSPPIIALHRMVMGEAGRFPELGRLVYERGPARGKQVLATYLHSAKADGRVTIGDPLAAATQFGALLQSGVFQDMLWGVRQTIDPADVARDIDIAVSTFLRAWAP